MPQGGRSIDRLRLETVNIVKMRLGSQLLGKERNFHGKDFYLCNLWRL